MNATGLDGKVVCLDGYDYITAQELTKATRETRGTIRFVSRHRTATGAMRKSSSTSNLTVGGIVYPGTSDFVRVAGTELWRSLTTPEGYREWYEIVAVDDEYSRQNALAATAPGEESSRGH